ncbi:unnamed protein product [Vicia faba]|uniref:PB1-like domain-containing protein n=1 Tax=Vicia faba TaxID=3906 RepID=A0AAV0ZL17_VICFA|nr:unnamed protein product [Vicia faba]
MGVFNLVFHHGESFVQDGHTYYRGGSETTVEGQDEDKWSFFEAVSLVKDGGYEGFRLWRKIPQTDEGFTNVVDDAGAVEVAKHCMSCRVHDDLWVEHGVEDMMTKVLVPNVDDFSTSSGDDSTGDYVDASQCFNDSEEERVIDVEEANVQDYVVSALQYQNLDPEKYVDPCYMREAYRVCYENNVSPINDMDMWPTVDAEELLPPQYKKGPGRPKKLRFRELDENGSRMRRVGVAYRCTHCDKFGHNSRKCQAKEQDPNALKRKRKTPRTKVSKKSDGTVDEGPEMDANVDTTATGGGTVDEDPEMDTNVDTTATGGGTVDEDPEMDANVDTTATGGGTVDEGPEMDANVDTTATGGGTVDEDPEMDANVDTTATGGGTVDEDPEMDANVDTTETGGGTVDEGPEMDALLNNMMDLYEEQQSQVDNPTQPTAMQPPPTHESQPAAMQPPPTHDSQPAAMQPGPAATNVKKPSARKKVVAVPWKRSRKRVSERLKEVRNSKRHGGPGSTPDAPLTIGEETGGSTSKKISRKKRKGIDQ